jgi:O-antigen ligase
VLLLNTTHVPLLGSAGEVELRPTDLLIAAVLVLSVVSARHRLGAALPWLWLAPFLAYLLVSTAAAEGDAALVGGAKLVEWLLYGVAITLSLETPTDRRILLVAMAWSALAFGAMGSVEAVVHAGRAESLLGANALGLLGAVALAIALGSRDRAAERTLCLGLAVGGTLCLVSAASIGAAIAATAVVLAAAALRAREGWRPRLRTVAATAALVALGVGVIMALRFEDIDAALGSSDQSPAEFTPRDEVGGSFRQRLMYADFGVRMWLDEPFLGVGFLQSIEPSSWLPHLPDVRADFPRLRGDYFPPAPGTPFANMVTPTFGTHNVYLQVLAELGLLGLALLVAGLGGLTRHAWRHTEPSARPALVLPVVAILVGFVDHQLFGGVPDTTLLAFTLGLAAAGGAGWSAEAGSGHRPSRLLEPSSGPLANTTR